MIPNLCTREKQSSSGSVVRYYELETLNFWEHSGVDNSGKNVLHVLCMHREAMMMCYIGTH